MNEAKPALTVFSHIGLNGKIRVKDLAQDLRARYSGPFVIGNDLMQIDLPTTASGKAMPSGSRRISTTNRGTDAGQPWPASAIDTGGYL